MLLSRTTRILAHISDAGAQTESRRSISLDVIVHPWGILDLKNNGWIQSGRNVKSN